MLRAFPSFLLGAVTLLLLTLNTLLFAAPLLAIIPVKILAPKGRPKTYVTRIMDAIAQTWVDGNTFIFRLTQKTQWDIQGLNAALKRSNWYLIISNHRSWADILVLQSVFNRKIPFPKFFIKQELLWFPVLGPIWWALDYPFMKRYSKKYLENNPEKAGKDFETTRRACEKFKTTPVTVLNFLEGTRFSLAKHLKQSSPYRHLLSPRAGGIAFALSAMGERFSEILDVTIVYPVRNFRFWHMLSGKLPRIVVRIEQTSIPNGALSHDYQNDTKFRKKFQEWTNQLWQQKDELIDEIFAECEEPIEA